MKQASIQTLQTRKSRAILVKGTPVCHWWEVISRSLYEHDCQRALESQNETDDVIWQLHSQSIWGINRSWKTHSQTLNSTTCTAAAFTMPKRWKERESLGANEKRKKWDTKTQQNMTQTWKCKKKLPFSGICRNLDWITVSKEGWINDISQHIPSRGD